MKKVICLLLGIFIFIPIITQGQVPTTVNSELREFDDSIYDGTEKIIKLNEDTTIVLAQRRISNNYAFYLVGEGANTSQLSELPSYLKVNDMKLFDDYLYFCGQYNNQEGFIGRLKVNILGSPTLDTIQWSKVLKSTNLNKLELYKDTLTTYTHIVAIGTYENGDIFLHSYEGTNWRYEIDTINNTLNTGTREYFKDLAVNKNYVVVAGLYDIYDTTTGYQIYKFLNIRKYDKYNIPTIAPIIYRYNYTVHNLSPLFDKLILKTIDDSNIAVAATIQYNSNTFGIVGKYNTYNPTVLSNIQLNGYVDTTKTEIRDISYNSINNKLSVLELTRTTTVPNTYWNYVFELDFNQNSYFAKVFTNRTIYSFNSIVEYKPDYYATIGIDILNNNMVIWDRNRNYTAYTNCDKFLNEHIWSTNITFIPYIGILPIFVDYIHFNQHIVPKPQRPININCQF